MARFDGEDEYCTGYSPQDILPHPSPLSNVKLSRITRTSFRRGSTSDPKLGHGSCAKADDIGLLRGSTKLRLRGWVLVKL